MNLLYNFPMKKFLLSLLDLIYKKRCYFCKKSNDNSVFCDKCYETLYMNSVSAKDICKSVNIFCAGKYEKTMQKLIRGVKYHNQKELAFYQAKFMSEYFNKLKLNKNYQVIPVPLYKDRQKKRGYNHMELVGEEFCKLTGMKLNTKLITRIKDTKPQYRLNKTERMENLKNAFVVHSEFLEKDLDILVIDDIFTTGSTFESMIEEFNKNKIFNITCLATASAN